MILLGILQWGGRKKANQGKAKMVVSSSKARRTMFLLVCTRKQKTAFVLYVCVLKFRVNDLYFESIFFEKQLVFLGLEMGPSG